MIAIEPVIAPAASLSAIRIEFEAIESPAAPLLVRITAALPRVVPLGTGRAPVRRDRDG